MVENVWQAQHQKVDQEYTVRITVSSPAHHCQNLDSRVEIAADPACRAVRKQVRPAPPPARYSRVPPRQPTAC
jgi:hypothetical protein